MGSSIVKWGFAFLGGIAAVLLNTAIFLVVCTIAICMDCYTAWALSKRVKERYPQSNDGKFKSKYASKIFGTLAKIYSLILLAYLLDHYVLIMFDGLFLSNFVTGIFCFVQIWSMLENESSCSGSKCAKIMQKFMVDKATRHFDIDLSELVTKKQNEDERN